MTDEADEQGDAILREMLADLSRIKEGFDRLAVISSALSDLRRSVAGMKDQVTQLDERHAGLMPKYAELARLVEAYTRH